jgi:hypothetical protein
LHNCIYGLTNLISEFGLKFRNSSCYSSFSITIWLPHSLNSGVWYKWKNLSSFEPVTGARPYPLRETGGSTGNSTETKAQRGGGGTQSGPGSERRFFDYLLISSSASCSNRTSAWPGYSWPGGYQVLEIYTKQVRQKSNIIVVWRKVLGLVVVYMKVFVWQMRFMFEMLKKCLAT